MESTLRIFASSPIRFSLVCRRPAVSSTSHFAPSGLCRRPAVPRGGGGRRRPVRALNEPHFEAPRPFADLLVRGGAESVACPEHHPAVGPENFRELRGGRRLARAVNANQAHNGRIGALRPSELPFGTLQNPRQNFRANLRRPPPAQLPVPFEFGLYRGNYVAHGVVAEIGLQKGLLYQLYVGGVDFFGNRPAIFPSAPPAVRASPSLKRLKSENISV